MKTLPDSPNLDHLRQQAKDLLPHLRALRPDATLADAQARVAEQYGFRTWPDLKAEVDRRLAGARTGDDGVAAAAAAAFDLGAPRAPLVAAKAVPWLLADPPTRARFEAILDAVA